MVWLKRIVVGALALVALVVLVIALAAAGLYGATALNARDGEPMLESAPTAARRPAVPALEIGALADLEPPDPAEPGESPDDATPASPDASVPEPGAATFNESVILFGDLHVHTVYSADAFLQSYKIIDLDSRRPPADACDFARFCSQLDFWSINDHAESLTPAHWRATVDAVRACNVSAGDPEDPDLVSYLGWEWSHAGAPDTHYGHKNVILRGLDDDEIPARPIASAAGPPWAFLGIGTLGVLSSPMPFEDFASFHRYALETLAVEDCPTGVSTERLPTDCRESATTPAALFAKLDEWDVPALVIPHGLAWGTTNPPHARLDVQLSQQDPRWQPLVEVYSGHGNSEVFVPFERPTLDADERWICPESSEGTELCCQRARDLVRARCKDPDSAACEDEIEEVVQLAASIDSGFGLAKPTSVLPDTTLDDWGECGQIQGGFLPAWSYRPRQSAQYALALGSIDGEATDQRFRWGFIGSSDTHRSRPGTGYKEFGRLIMTDGVGYPIPDDVVDARSDSFYYSGGLAAVHSSARDRNSIFDALSRREVYGTSGDRILLWFDLIDDSGIPHPMGSELTLPPSSPRLAVRAVGARKQKPGCPPFVHEALSRERIESLCLGECYHPSDERKRITRLEVVRIRPQQSGDEPIASRIEDPWRVFECPDDPAGCRAEFEDPEFAISPAETVYYVRAIQEPSDAINGDPLRCERDESGRCVAMKTCGTGRDGRPEDCLAPVHERAWSSPIFVTPES